MTICHERHFCTWAWRLAIAMAVAVTAGCASLMGPPLYKPDKQGRARFDSHNVTALCFNTRGCRVEYANFYLINSPEDHLLPPRRADKILVQQIRGGFAGFRNFPTPAIVQWRSSDGERHRAEIDVSKVFRDQVYLHHVPPQDIRDRAFLIEPTILFVVDDREVSVYMSSYIPLRDSIDRGFMDPIGPYQIVRAFKQTY